MADTTHNGAPVPGKYGPPGTILQFDYCVSESQRFADLFGIKLDLESAKR